MNRYNTFNYHYVVGQSYLVLVKVSNIHIYIVNYVLLTKN